MSFSETETHLHQSPFFDASTEGASIANFVGKQCEINLIF